MTHKKFKKLMVEEFYGGLPAHERSSFHAHLDECPDCAKAYERLTSTLGLMQQRQRPEHDEAYWNAYWQRLESEIHRHALAPKSRSWLERLLDLMEPKIAYAAGAAVILVVLGIVVGRFMIEPPDQQSLASGQSAPSAAMNSVQLKRAEEYLDRSRMLLLGIVNYDTAGAKGRLIDLSRQQRVSRELLNEARVLQAGLKDPDQARLRKLVSDLEIIMLQIANLEAQNDYPGIEIVKNGVDRNALLLKINLEQMQMDKHTFQLKSKPNS